MGGNISSGSGVLRGLLNNGYDVHVLSDSKLPEIGGLNQSLKYLPFRFFGIRRLLFQQFRLAQYWSVFQRIENLLFRLDLTISARGFLDQENYEFVYMRASFHGHGLTNALNSERDTLVLEVNKPLSMASFNNEHLDSWPADGEQIRVSVAEKLQYEAAALINVDSTLRLKWILDFVDPTLSRKALINFNGVDTEMFTPTSEGNMTRKNSQGNFVSKESFGWSERSIVVGVASSFRWYNDISEMLEIFALAAQSAPQLVFLVIVGDLKKASDLEQELAGSRLSTRVKVLKQIPFTDMPLYLNACDILISHFNFRGKWPHNCSIKHMEYLSVAKPVVATNVGEVNFAIENGVNGFLCKEGDIDGFATAISKLAFDNDMRQKFGAAGRSKAIETLSWDRHVNNVLEAIREIN